ncbi:MAG: tyrosine-type recombinase/integrase [Terriglobia bacterium]
MSEESHSLEMISGRHFPALLARAGSLPSPIVNAGDNAAEKFIEFFTAQIRNRNTREAYARAVGQFRAWCEKRGLSLSAIRPVHVAAYIEKLSLSPPTVKQHLAAIRMLFDWLVVSQVIPMNPAAAVRGPKYVTKRGKTPVLSPDQARKLLDSINTKNIVGLRDRAVIGVMVYSFARVSAVAKMKIADYYDDGRRSWFRFHEKGGKRHEVPAHHNAQAYVDAYVTAAKLNERETKEPLFRSVNRKRALTDRPLSRVEVFLMIKRRARAAGLPPSTCCHTFRATGITAYLSNGGTLENAQAIAAHESPRTTKLYDRTNDEITLDEVERILI